MKNARGPTLGAVVPELSDGLLEQTSRVEAFVRCEQLLQCGTSLEREVLAVGQQGVALAQISQLTARRLRNAGIAVVRPGSHTLRHTCVQRLVEAQFSLKAIGDYVGHSLPKSTEIYTKIDLEALREMALGDGEELL